MLRRLLLGLGVAVWVAGCDGKALFQQDSDDNQNQKGGGPGGSPPDITIPLPAESQVTPSGMHRLTADEYDNTLRDLLGDTTRPGMGVLPEDATDPFDNDYKQQMVSGALIESVEILAEQAAARALADPAKRAAIVPCTPTGPADAECFREFITTFGRRALRQPLSEEDIQSYLGLQSLAIEANDFWVGVDLALRAMLQDPRFLYRVEIGTPVEDKPGVYLLSPFEVASRLSYYLWGSTPPDWLLDAAEQGQLSTTEQIVAAAERLLEDERARARVKRFHALWLGYHKLPHAPDLTRAMTTESDALVERVVFEEQGDYFDLFRADSTYVDSVLAAHYGLPAPGSGTAGWVSYGASGRQGILSHGSVLSQGVKFTDTSPTQRGLWIRNRLFCQEIPPPPTNVNPDEPPATDSGSNCKKDRYSAHANVGSCKACHEKMDGIGWGLEQYDREGRFRTHDDDNEACLLDGNGNVPELGDFNGPAGLANLLMNAGGVFERCIATQVFRFANGRREIPQDADTIDNLVRAWTAEGRRFDQLLIAVVADPTFVYRKEE